MKKNKRTKGKNTDNVPGQISNQATYHDPWCSLSEKTTFAREENQRLPWSVFVITRAGYTLQCFS